jgi:hypothetical protein
VTKNFKTKQQKNINKKIKKKKKYFRLYGGTKKCLPPNSRAEIPKTMSVPADAAPPTAQDHVCPADASSQADILFMSFEAPQLF